MRRESFLTVRVPSELLEIFKETSKTLGLPKSELVRNALSSYAYSVRPLLSELHAVRRGDTIIFKAGPLTLGLSFTSLGGVGEKPLDQLKVPSYLVGQIMARSVLLELISLNMWPKGLLLSICMEPSEESFSMVKGASKELQEIGLNPAESLHVNYEEYFKPQQTAASFTAYSVAHTPALKIGSSSPGDILVLAGRKAVGSEILKLHQEGKLITCKMVSLLAKAPYVKELIPLDSKGLTYAANELAKASGLQAKLKARKALLNSPFGPCAALLLSVDPSREEDLKNFIELPVTIVGFLA
ncbi:MAG: ribbon-helix-helix protein, CopG family [Candidatus Verstraetearchaeota archaeon]|nr:ribbon-helix-helix protein, CopG family [Candidatus Verstraetearchaeota archaeon]